MHALSCLQDRADTPRPHIAAHRDLATLNKRGDAENGNSESEDSERDLKGSNCHSEAEIREAGSDAEGSKADDRGSQEALESEEGGLNSGKAEYTDEPESSGAEDTQEAVGLNCSCYQLDQVCAPSLLVCGEILWLKYAAQQANVASQVLIQSDDKVSHLSCCFTVGLAAVLSTSSLACLRILSLASSSTITN